MRGKDCACHRYCAVNGITPAYAGKSKVEKMKYTFYRDHPRICGEKTKKIP